MGVPILLGPDPAKVAVSSAAVIENLDVIRDVRQCELASGVDAFLDALLFQAAPKRLRHGIIPAISLPAHARFEMI